MISNTLIYLNLFTGISLTIYIFLHAIFDSNISTKHRWILMFPGFSMVCYSLISLDWAYREFVLTNSGPNIQLLVVVAWMVVISAGIIAYLNWSPQNEEGY